MVRGLTGGKPRLESTADVPAAGLLVHVAAETDDGFLIFDVFESPDAFDNFRTIESPIARRRASKNRTRASRWTRTSRSERFIARMLH